MESSATETEALGETIVFPCCFKDLLDPRQAGKVLSPRDEILSQCLLGVAGGAETIADIATLGRLKLPLLRRFRAFVDGTPALDRLGDVLATLEAEAFGHCLAAWVTAQTGVSAELVAIDGGTARRSRSWRPT